MATFGQSLFESMAAARAERGSLTREQWVEIADKAFNAAVGKRVRRDSFVPPTTEQVAAYCLEIGYQMDAAAWCDHYGLKGWVTSGTTKMRDWKCAVRVWRSHSWLPSGPNSHVNGNRVTFTPASLGALQMREKQIVNELSELVYPGGCAWPVKLEGEKKERHAGLVAEKEAVKRKISEASR